MINARDVHEPEDEELDTENDDLESEEELDEEGGDD